MIRKGRIISPRGLSFVWRVPMFDQQFLDAQKRVAAEHDALAKKTPKKVGFMCVDYKMTPWEEQFDKLLEMLFPYRVPAGLFAKPGSGVLCLAHKTLRLLHPEVAVVIAHGGCAALADARNGGPMAEVLRAYGFEPGISDREYALEQRRTIREQMEPDVRVVSLFIEADGIPWIFKGDEYVLYSVGEPIF
jgi:hypothetical protein